MAVLAGCRQDMHNQPKFIPLRSSEFYSDRRSARYPVPGTIPQLDDKNVDKEQLDPNSYFLTGKHGNTYGNELPAARIKKQLPQSWRGARSATTFIASPAIRSWAMETA